MYIKSRSSIYNNLSIAHQLRIYWYNFSNKHHGYAGPVECIIATKDLLVGICTLSVAHNSFQVFLKTFITVQGHTHSETYHVFQQFCNN